MTTPFDDTFPTAEIFVDCCGQRHEFRIELLDNDRGFFLRATEHVSGDDGYAFAAHSETDPYLALGRLRRKIHEGLAIRYLSKEDGQRSLSHEAAVGHITDGGVVVDGRRLTYGEFATILSAYEGWQFSLKITDGYGAF